MELRAGSSHATEGSGTAATTQPGANDIAAVLVDLFLPDSRGIDTFDQIFRAAPQIPILILTTPQNEEVAKLAVLHGAQDYLLTTRIDAYLLPKTVRSTAGEEITGWARDEAAGCPIEKVFRIVDASTREAAQPEPRPGASDAPTPRLHEP